jgi:hypothetical protein
LGLQNSIHAVASELGLKAQAAGYNSQTAIDRLAYGSFVSAARRYLYMETPKAACTSFKHLIAAVEGVPPQKDALPYQRETRPDMLVHQRRHFGMPNLLNADKSSREAILSRAPGWMIFALVRNPFSRLVSFFENKIRLGEPGYRQLEARYGDTIRFGGLRASFTAFVEEVVAEPDLRRGDYHLLSQAELIMPRLIPYTHVFRLEAAEEAVAVFAAHLAHAGAGLPSMAMAFNRSPARDWRGYYDQRSARIVASAYHEDFSLFGYDADDWQGVADLPAPAASEEFWRSELVARNAMLDRLYSHLGAPPALNPAELRLIKKTTDPFAFVADLPLEIEPEKPES